jgi:hypothetical protein
MLSTDRSIIDDQLAVPGFLLFHEGGRSIDRSMIRTFSVFLIKSCKSQAALLHRHINQVAES